MLPRRRSQPDRRRPRRAVGRAARPVRQAAGTAPVASLGTRPAQGAALLVHDRPRHGGAAARQSGRGRGLSGSQDQARQVRLATGSAADDRGGPRARDARDGGLHDRIVARHHRRRPLHAARGLRGPGRRGADGGRPVRGRDHRRRADSPASRAGARCPAARVNGGSVGAQHAAPLPSGEAEPRLQPRTPPTISPAGDRAPGLVRYAEVVLPLPVARPYTYRIPDGLAARAVPGARVVVPLRRRRVVALVTAVDVPPPSVEARPILDAPDGEPALSPALLELGRWMSRYYGTPLGLALRAILPGPLWSVRRPAGPAVASERVLVLAQPLGSLLERERAFRRAPRRRAAYEALEALGGSAPARHLVDQLKVSPAVLDGLVKQGLARYERVAAVRDPFAGLSSAPPLTLTADQRRVVDRILARPPGGPALGRGVTGSGKTLAYLGGLRSVVASCNGAGLLVPRIAPTPQTRG